MLFFRWVHLASMNNEKQYQSEPTRKLVQVLGEVFDSLLANQERIIALMGEGGQTATTSRSIGEYLSQEEAEEWLQRGKTWFWNMRTTGQLGFSKIGNKVFYKKSDIEELLNENHQEGFRKW
jgi:hypothetical protein